MALFEAPRHASCTCMQVLKPWGPHITNQNPFFCRALHMCIYVYISLQTHCKTVGSGCLSNYKFVSVYACRGLGGGCGGSLVFLSMLCCLSNRFIASIQRARDLYMTVQLSAKAFTQLA